MPGDQGQSSSLPSDQTSANSSTGQQGQNQSQGSSSAQSGSSASNAAKDAEQQGNAGAQGQMGGQTQQSAARPGMAQGSAPQGAAQDSSQGIPQGSSQSSPQGRAGEIDFSEAGGTVGAAAGQAGENGQDTANSGPAGQGQGLPSASSYEERVAVLDRQLEGSMSDYDGMILRERRNIHSRADEMGSEQQVETFDRDIAYYDEGDLDGSDGDGQGGQQAAGGHGGEESPQVAQASGNPYGSDAGGPGRANDTAHAPPGDIPSGDDDDVVARQIREAAMYEDDPELREKLWDEYRKYKEQTR